MPRQHRVILFTWGDPTTDTCVKIALVHGYPPNRWIEVTGGWAFELTAALRGDCGPARDHVRFLPSSTGRIDIVDLSELEAWISVHVEALFEPGQGLPEHVSIHADDLEVSREEIWNCLY